MSALWIYGLLSISYPYFFLLVKCRKFILSHFTSYIGHSKLSTGHPKELQPQKKAILQKNVAKIVNIRASKNEWLIYLYHHHKLTDGMYHENLLFMKKHKIIFSFSVFQIWSEWIEHCYYSPDHLTINGCSDNICRYSLNCEIYPFWDHI